MSLLTFQRALADFAASPDLCRAAIADPVPVLRSYELSSRERLRLASMVRDRLMATNWRGRGGRCASSASPELRNVLSASEIRNGARRIIRAHGR